MSNVVVSLLNKVVIGSSLFGFGTFLLTKSACVVYGGERALIWDRHNGIRDNVLSEGAHLLIPFWEKPIFMNVRTTPKQIDTETGSKDLQTVNISVRVLYRPNESFLPSIARNLGLDYDERILPSLGHEVLKAVVAQYNANELITQREAVSNEIRVNLTERSRSFHILLEDVSITHLGFSEEYTHAIEAKQVAQQEAERAKFVVLKAEQEMKAAVTRAEGEAEAARLIGEATQKYGPSFIELRRLEAAKEIAETLSKSKNVVYVPPDNRLFLNLGKT
ncbi:prohibitin-1, mitochondrial-like [Schistocerca gregaria]|uniref:prohibitin-1, mitochondrial-like n=1 Tax=Schistocerca gregaria TaxID=7010 RepID=UPI00211F2784|nr:prohibitin-1, mitochondrial-like [Schistocerca gregaria]